jgi:hypothetical protein
MFWKKKRKPEDSAAQHLANLIGTSVAGFIPESPFNKVDLDFELFTRNNTAIASLVIISGLIKGDPTQREAILRSIKPDHLGNRSLESYLFRLISDELSDKGNVSLDAIEKSIPQHSQVDYGEPPNEKMLQGDYYKWNQILNFELTDAHISKAIDYLQKGSPDKERLDNG